ncbi:MAG: hypothetical protein WAQ24_05830 [Candidatus Saccharimonadales bacterium]
MNIIQTAKRLSRSISYDEAVRFSVAAIASNNSDKVRVLVNEVQGLKPKDDVVSEAFAASTALLMWAVFRTVLQFEIQRNPSFFVTFYSSVRSYVELESKDLALLLDVYCSEYPGEPDEFGKQVYGMFLDRTNLHDLPEESLIALLNSGTSTLDSIDSEYTIKP